MITERCLVTSDLAALHLTRIHRYPITPITLRQWARRYPDDITRHGRKGRRALYDLGELQTLAERLFA